MTRRYDRSRGQRNERINWSLDELKELINNKNSQVHMERTKRHIALYPYHLYDLKKSLHEILGAEVNRYNQELKGLLLAYKNPKLLSRIGAILYDTPFIHVDVEADFYIFKPEIDSVLKGIINKKAANHIGVLVHKVFNVSIPKEDEEDENWMGNYYDVGDEVKFTVKQMDFKGRLPFIRGTLISSDGDEDDNDEGFSVIFTKKKAKKHKFTEEELNFPDDNPPENSDIADTNNSDVRRKKFGFLSSIYDANSSDSEEEFDKLKKRDKTKLVNNSTSLKSKEEKQVLNGKKKIIHAMKTVVLSSSDDSNSDSEAIKRGKKSSKCSSPSVHENFEDNKHSVLENGVLKSIKTESPKKSKNSNRKKKWKEEFPEELTVKEPEELPVVPRKRKHPESQDSDSLEDSKRNKKSKKSRKSSMSDEWEQDLTVKKKVKKETERKGFNDHSVNEKDDAPSSSQENGNKALKEPKEEDSDEDLSHFLPLRKIKVEREENSLKTVRKEKKRDKPSFITKYNSSDDSGSEPEAPEKASSKKAAKSSTISLHEDTVLNSIKSESSKKSKNSSQNKKNEDAKELPAARRKRKHSESENSQNSDDLQSIKKSKKSRKSSISEDSEQDSPVKKKVKVEKESDDLNDHSITVKDEAASSEPMNDDRAPKEPEEDDSDDDVSHFLYLRKIKIEKEENALKTVRKEREIVDNSLNTSVNLEEDIKEENVIKKSKKSKKQENLQEEENSAVAVIKKEKDDVINAKSTRILNLQIEDSDSDCEMREIKNEEDTLKRKKSKKTLEINGDTDDDGIESANEIKIEKKKEKRKKSGNIEEQKVHDDVEPNSHDCPSPTRAVKVEKTKTVKIPSRYQDDNGELSDASVSRSKILIKKEESVFFGNIKLKQESYSSDVEFLGSKRRQREQEISSDEKNTIDDITIKNEESVNVKSEESDKTKKIKIENSQNVLIKNESDVKSKKKVKTVFSE